MIISRFEGKYLASLFFSLWAALTLSLPCSIKPSSDGPPSCFSNAADTQIPALRAFVHATTAKYRVHFSNTFSSTVSDLVDRVKLYATDAKSGGGSRASRRCKSVFDTEMKKVESHVAKLAQAFRSKAEQKVHSMLQPALRIGSQKGQASAMSTVMSWSS
jgi:hypothetical protein